MAGILYSTTAALHDKLRGKYKIVNVQPFLALCSNEKVSKGKNIFQRFSMIQYHNTNCKITGL